MRVCVLCVCAQKKREEKKEMEKRKSKMKKEQKRVGTYSGHIGLDWACVLFLPLLYSLFHLFALLPCHWSDAVSKSCTP